MVCLIDDVTSNSGLLLTGIVIFIVFYLWNRRSRINLPPGPPGLPIIGNLHQLTVPAFFTYEKLFKQYGKIFYFRLGQRPAVFISSVQMLKTYFTQNSFNGSLRSSLLDHFIRDSGIVFIDGDKWKFHRRLSLQIFRDLGVGKSVSESIVREEAMELCQYLEHFISNEKEELVETSHVFSCSTINVISLFLFRERPGYNNKIFNEFMSSMHFFGNNQSLFSLLSVTFPFMSVLNPLFLLSKFARGANLCLDVIYKQLATHRQQGSSNEISECSNYIEAYHAAREQNERKMPKEWMQKYFNDFQIVRLVFEFYATGMDTSSTTLCWAVMLLSIHDSVRQKMAVEIHNIIGTEKIVSMEDKKHFQYSLAVIDEIMRYSSIIPVAIHKAMEDVKIGEYDIPNDTLILANLYAIHHDPDIWEKPNEFYPQHFLSKDGMSYCPREDLIPFGVGKRSCLGESLARIEIFIFIITLVQRYRFEVHFDHEKGESLEKCLKGTNGIVRGLGPHKMQFFKLYRTFD